MALAGALGFMVGMAGYLATDDALAELLLWLIVLPSLLPLVLGVMMWRSSRLALRGTAAISGGDTARRGLAACRCRVAGFCQGGIRDSLYLVLSALACPDVSMQAGRVIAACSGSLS